MEAPQRHFPYYFQAQTVSPWRNIASLLVTAIIISGCATSTSERPPTITSNTNSAYLELIKNLEANNSGATGDGIIVSVFDTGIDANHQSLANKVTGGLDFISNNPNSKGHLQDSQGHGTHIAGLIAATNDSNNVQGIAPNAKLLSYRILNDDKYNRHQTVTDEEISLGYRHALASGSYIYNNSWSTDDHVGSTAITTFQKNNAEFLTQAQKNVDAGGVFVFAAGNNSTLFSKNQVHIEAGLPYYFARLQPGWLAVVAIGDGNELADYSNKCGLAKAWCLAAPGGGSTGLESLKTGGGTAFKSGTSMATGIVSGSLAALLAKFGSASFNAQDAATRLLASANKTGVYSNTDLYGQGMLNLKAALTVMGTPAIPQGASLTSNQKTDLSRSTLALPAAVKTAIVNQLPNRSLLVVDSFQSVPFQMAAKDLINTSSNTNVFDHQSPNSGPLESSMTSSTHAFTLLPSLQLVVSDPDASLFGDTNSTKLQLQWWSSQASQPVNSRFVYSMLEHGLAADTNAANHSLFEAGLQINGTQIYSNYQTNNTYNQSISTSGAFAQSTSGLMNYGVRIKQPGSFAHVDTTLTLEQSRWQPNESINSHSLWQWHDHNKIMSMRLDSHYQPTDASNHSAGGYLQAQKYQGNDAASIRLPYAFEQDGSVLYKTISLSGASLFDQHSAGLFWQWSNSPSWGVKTQVVFKRQGNDTRSGLRIEFASRLGQQ